MKMWLMLFKNIYSVKKPSMAGFKVCAWEKKWQILLVKIKTVILAQLWANEHANSKLKCAYICS